MVRILLVLSACIALVAGYDVLSLNRAVNGLVGFPWGREPEKIRFLSGWRDYPYGEMDDRMEPGYAFASRVKIFNRNLSLRLFTYAEPSLYRNREVVLMGAVEGLVKSEIRARRLQDRFLVRLRAKGFAETASDQVAFTRSKEFRRERIIPIARGNLIGHVYYCADSLRHEWRVRAVIQHPLARQYGNEYAVWWPRWWQFDRFNLPERLVRDLELSGIDGMFQPGDWERIKNIVHTGGREVSLSDLERFYEAVITERVSPSRRPVFLLLKNYLARYLFFFGIPKIPKGSWFAEEELDTFRIDLLPLEQQRRVIYGETFLFRLAREYPDTFWGQYAFLETFRMWLTPPTKERSDHWAEDLRRAGREFLARHPDSEFTPDILFLLGRLAEKEYSVTIIHENRTFYEKNRWRDRPLDVYVEGKRLAALDIYRQVLTSPSRHEFEEYLKYTLPRLCAGVGTGCTYSWWR